MVDISAARLNLPIGDIVPATKVAVIPAQAGIQCVGPISSIINQMHDMDSGLRRNDGWVIDCFLNSARKDNAGNTRVGG